MHIFRTCSVPTFADFSILTSSIPHEFWFLLFTNTCLFWFLCAQNVLFIRSSFCAYNVISILSLLLMAFSLKICIMPGIVNGSFFIIAIGWVNFLFRMLTIRWSKFQWYWYFFSSSWSIKTNKDFKSHVENDLVCKRRAKRESIDDGFKSSFEIKMAYRRHVIMLIVYVVIFFSSKTIAIAWI